jgi:signal transduction histidine kinase
MDDYDSAVAERRQRRLFLSACLLGWCALVIVTASFMPVVRSLTLPFALGFALGFWGFYLLATPAVLWLARRFPLTRETWRAHIWVHLLSTLLFVAFCDGGFGVVVYLLEPHAIEIMLEQNAAPGADLARSAHELRKEFEGGFPKPSLRFLLFTKSQLSIPLYWVLVGVAHSLSAMSALREREKQAARLTAHLTQAQLASLRTQLQPHFLFNTLNSIAALIPRDAKLATEMVMNLSDLLRMTLREPQHGEIRLGEELKLLRHYIDIQQLRFGARLRFQVEAGEDALEACLPPLLLQPLVENAIRHGLEASDQPESIRVSAEVVDQELRMVVTNTFTGERQESAPASTGLGLANTQARLRAQYGEQQHFQAGPLAGGGFQVTIRVPFHTRPAP